MHPDDRERAAGRLPRGARDRASPYRDEYRLLDADGRERWFHDQTVVVRDEHGAPIEIQGVIHDITDRKRAEQALHESEWRLRAAEARYRSLVEQLPLGIYVNALDEAGTPIYRSPATEAITGRSPRPSGSRTRRCSPTIIHPDDRDRVLAGISTAARRRRRRTRPSTGSCAPTGASSGCSTSRSSCATPDGAQPCRQGYLLDVTEHRRAEERLAHVAYHDPLTGLPNLGDVPGARARRPSRGRSGSGDGVAVLLVDLDDFKLVNDSFGHAAGDALVLEAARRLRGDGRATRDAVSRLGGDEFAILLADLDPGRGGGGTGLAADAMAERIRAALRAPAELAGTEIYCSASVGISLYPADAADPMNLLKHADTALHQAKASGRDAQRRYTHASVDALEQLAMAGRLRRAIDEGEPAAALPAAGRPDDRRDRRRRGARALAGRQAPGDAGRLHPAGRAHRPDRRRSRNG